MKNLYIVLMILLLCFTNQISNGQDTAKDKEFEKALTKMEDAIKLVDGGKFIEGIKIIEECCKSYPDNSTFAYELGYCNYLNKDFKNALKCLEGFESNANLTEDIMALLATIYDEMGDFKKAMECFDRGFLKFPKSGKLYLEKAIALMNDKQRDKALAAFEKGIEVDPMFPSNYYHAAKIYCGSTDTVWGLFYGEIYMNLDRKSKRNLEISKLLFDTYNAGIDFTKSGSVSCKFSDQERKNHKLENAGEKDDLAFDVFYDFSMETCLAVDQTKNIDLKSLDRIRASYIKSYFEKKSNKTYPNILFDYQDKLIKAGHFEAYNYWIFMKGEESVYTKWQAINKDKDSAFKKWFEENPLKLDEKNRFYRLQYSKEKPK